MRDVLREITRSQLSAYGSIANQIEDHWESQIVPIRKRLEEADRVGDSDGVEWHSEEWAMFEMTHMSPQREALFIGLWAFFEGCLVSFNREVLTNLGHNNIQSPRQNIIFSSLDSLKKYGNLYLASSDQTAQLTAFRDLRNCIAHNGGRVDGTWSNETFHVTKSSDKAFIALLKERGLGDLHTPRIEVTEKLVPYVASLLSECLGSLHDQDSKLRPDSGVW